MEMKIQGSEYAITTVITAKILAVTINAIIAHINTFSMKDM